MKRVFLAIVLAVTFSTAGAQNAKIKIDLGTNEFAKWCKTTKKADIRASGQKITYSFAPHSFTMIKGRINR